MQQQNNLKTIEVAANAELRLDVESDKTAYLLVGCLFRRARVLSAFS